MTQSWLAAAGNRALLSLTTFPNLGDSINVVIITIATTATAGLIAATSGFIDPIEDFDPPWRRRHDGNDIGSCCHRFSHWSMKPISVFFFPSLAEEFFWRGILIDPHPSEIIATNAATSGVFSSPMLLRRAGLVLGIHVLLHPFAGYTCWPRGRKVFCDWRFLVSATIVLGGATLSYLVSGGSVWAAALTHGLPVALWRDFFGGEALLMKSKTENENDTNSGEKI